MGIRDNIRAEFERTPLTLIATCTGVIVAIVALFVAWHQYSGPPVGLAQKEPPSVPSASGLNLSNLLIVVAFFLTSSLSTASLVRILERYHRFAAMVLSVPAAVVVGFATMLVLTFVPPRSPSVELFQRAQDLTFWATLFVFLAIAGASSAHDIAATPPKKAPDGVSNKTEPDGFAMVIALLIALGIWGSLVWAGLTKLTQLFLG